MPRKFRDGTLTMQIELKGKTALVTGGARDIGRAVALKLAEAGAAVAVNYFASREQAESVVAEIKAKGSKAIAIKADVAKADEVKRLIDETRAAFGTIHVLVNNAGGLRSEEHTSEL